MVGTGAELQAVAGVFGSAIGVCECAVPLHLLRFQPRVGFAGATALAFARGDHACAYPRRAGLAGRGIVAQIARLHARHDDLQVDAIQ